MRENMGLYHGKRVDNGKWVEGYFFETNAPVYRAFIIVDMAVDITDGYTDILGFNIVEVDPETVGQYTGLTDENGKKIFEGDVVREYGGEYAQGFYEIDGNLIVEIPNTLANFILGSDCGCKYKIIGNIHDNPELRKWCSQ